MFSTALVCFVAAASIIIVNAEKKYNNQSEVMDDMVDNMFTCMQELEINTDVCTELLMKDKDHSDKKYNNCKCLGPCVAKKLGTMNRDTGKWDWDRIKELSDLMENDLMKNEAKIINSACYDEVNTHCEAGFAIMKCMLNNSPMIQDMAKNFLAAKAIMKNEEEYN